MTDEQLLANAVAGDESAFVALYQRHRTPVFRFAYRVLGSVDLAEDVVHDCLLGLMERPQMFDPVKGELRTYLYGAARNLANKHFRRTVREDPDVELSDLELVDCGPNQPGILIADERARAVQQAIAALPPLQREALILFEYEELSLDQIATIVEADLSAVKSRLHRARQNLRKTLAPLFAAPVESARFEEAVK